MKKVLILYKFLPHYRIDFFNQLKERLDKEGIELTLVYGKLKNKDSKKRDEVDLDWGHYVSNKTIRIGKREIYWQPGTKYIKTHDLIIVEQANKLLINYYLIFLRLFTKKKFAFWGHGRNLQDRKNSIGNKFKNTYLRSSDWFFAYTEGVKRYLLENDYPEQKITVVQNAIDTKALHSNYNSVTEKEITELKESLGIRSERTAIYVGGIYSEKRIEFLLDACRAIKEKIRDFHLIVVGGGPDAYIVERAAKEEKWIHYVGPKFGREKAAYFKLASFFLMPGLVGLAILDSFATQTPIITTEYEFHSPEIEYLENNVNGIISKNDLNSYVAAVTKAFLDNSVYQNLREGCKIAAEKYTNESMVDNFYNGVIACLND